MDKFGTPEFLFLLQGLKWTVLLTIISFIGGSFIGLAIALARVSSIKPVQTISAAYIALFQGTPLLMQLFVIYYGLALMSFNIDAWVAVSIAYTAHASAFLGDIWRGTIQSLPRGQIEASNGCCQTNSNQSQFPVRCRDLCRTKLTPFGESGGSVAFEIVSGGERSILIEVVVNGRMNGCEFL